MDCDVCALSYHISNQPNKTMPAPLITYHFLLACLTFYERDFFKSFAKVHYDI